MPPSHRFPARSRAGFSLIELLIAMTMMLAITAAAWSLFQSQSKNFRDNLERWEMIQNARAALEESERAIRTMGAGAPNGQPVLVYGATDAIAFNTDYVERDTVDMRWAAYFNPDAPADESQAWDASAATTIPNSSPTFVYPSMTYTLAGGVPSPAETYIFYFEADGSTTRGDDYLLYQRINAGNPEVVARNILPHPNGKPFFEYLLQRQRTGLPDTLILAAGTDLPLQRRTVVSGLTPGQVADYVRPDSVRAVRLNFRLTNGRSGADERYRDMSTTVETPNNGIALPTVCGRAPTPPSSFNIVDLGGGRAELHWGPSADETSGEHDVTQYIIYRRFPGATSWGGPKLVVRAETAGLPYVAELADNAVGTPYEFGIATQDCTPSVSSVLSVNFTPTP